MNALNRFCKALNIKQPGHIRWMSRNRRMRRLDEMTMGVADRYGMRKMFLAVRRIRLDPLEALGERDLLGEVAMKKLNEK